MKVSTTFGGIEVKVGLNAAASEEVGVTEVHANIKEMTSDVELSEKESERAAEQQMVIIRAIPDAIKIMGETVRDEVKKTLAFIEEVKAEKTPEQLLDEAE